MAFLFCDSFDHYATADITTKWTSTASGNPTIAISGSAGRRSTSGLQLSFNTFQVSDVTLRKTLTTSGAGFVAGVYYKAAAAPGSSHYIMGIIDSGTAHVWLRVNSDFTISVLNGSGSVLGTSGATSLAAGVGGYVEWKGTIDNSTGTYTVRVNQVSVLTGSSKDTQNTANATWNAFWLGQALGGFTGYGSTIDFDDLYVLDQSGGSSNDFWGDVRVDALLPSGAGTTANFTPSAGSNYQNVDDATPDGDSTNNTTSSAGNLDTFAMPDAPVSGATIKGVQHCIYAKKGDAGTCTIGAVVRHSGSNYVATDLAPTTSYAFLLTPQDQNPGTSAAWTESGWNAIECGYKKVT